MREVYRGRIVRLVLEDVDLPNGKTATFEVVHHPGAAAIVALDGDGSVVLLRQFRHAAGGYIWEIPAGTLGAGEPPADCARRELREETGLDAARWTPLGRIVTAPGFCDERIHLYLARDLSQAEQQLDADEILTVSRVPFARALEMIASGDIEDAKSIAALHLAQYAVRAGQ
ncbi:MAG: NUDIX hydrolase [bacterium]